MPLLTPNPGIFYTNCCLSAGFCLNETTTCPHDALLAVDMKKLLFLLVLLMAGLPGGAQTIPYIKSARLTHWKNVENDTLYVLNFWATWCAPCVAELPAFEKLHRQYAGKKVKVILISTDFRRDVDKKVIPFVKRKNLQSQVVFLDERTPNEWINLVSEEWTGSIPATLIVNKKGGYERFFEKQLSYKELEKAVVAGLKKIPDKKSRGQ